MTLFDLAKDYRPLLFFGFMSLLFFVLGLIVGVPVIQEFVNTAYITKVPSAILASGLMIIAVLLVMLGLIIDHQANEEKREHELYVQIATQIGHCGQVNRSELATFSGRFLSTCQFGSEVFSISIV